MRIVYDYVLYHDGTRAWGGTRREILRYIRSLGGNAVEALRIENGSTGTVYPASVYNENIDSQDLHVLW